MWVGARLQWQVAGPTAGCAPQHPHSPPLLPPNMPRLARVPAQLAACQGLPSLSTLVCSTATRDHLPSEVRHHDGKPVICETQAGEAVADAVTGVHSDM